MRPALQAFDLKMTDNKDVNGSEITAPEPAETQDDDRMCVVPPNVIKRLPRYYRYLRALLADDVRRVSSHELANFMNLTASQIRQDFSRFGGFGQQGYGYNVKYLYMKISELLGVSSGLKAVIVGAGNLGSALAHSRLFERRGIRLCALFDNDSRKFGKFDSKLDILSVDMLETYITENKIDIAVMTMPGEAAESIARRLVSCGIGGLWNFTNTELHRETKGTALENVHLGDSLLTLCYNITNKNGK